MSLIVLLDSGPLGIACNPGVSRETEQFNHWLEAILNSDAEVLVPEIADYEVRRELLRARLRAAIKRLDALHTTLGYVPLTSESMLTAAEFWAEARQRGRPTASDAALDGDVILAAQAVVLQNRGNHVVVATTNAGHLAQFVAAKRWEQITV